MVECSTHCGAGCLEKAKLSDRCLNIPFWFGKHCDSLTKIYFSVSMPDESLYGSKLGVAINIVQKAQLFPVIFSLVFQMNSTDNEGSLVLMGVRVVNNNLLFNFLNILFLIVTLILSSSDISKLNLQEVLLVGVTVFISLSGLLPNSTCLIVQTRHCCDKRNLD